MNTVYKPGVYMAHYHGKWQRFHRYFGKSSYFVNKDGFWVHLGNLTNITPCQVIEPPEPHPAVTEEPMDLAVRLVDCAGDVWARLPDSDYWAYINCSHTFPQLLDSFGPLTEWRADQMHNK